VSEAVGARYTAVAIVLHWAIAAAIVANLALGWWMHHAIDDAALQVRAIAGYQLHKSLGLTILALTLLRLGWRLAHRPPLLPEGMSAWERLAARTVHWAFYALMIVVPLSGWTYASAQWRGDAPLSVPTRWFGLFEVPHLFDARAVGLAERKAIAARNLAAHFWLAWITGGLLVLHVAAALKHSWLDRDTVLASMLPAGRASRVAGSAVLALAILAFALAAAVAPSRARGAITAAPGSWAIDPASEIAFAGTYEGVLFRGRFTGWQADLRFNPLAAGAVTVAATVETATATDGVPMHDEMLRLPEWFDITRYPQARFVATRIGPKPGGGHTVEGALTIKDRVIAVPPLDLSISGEALVISGRFSIDRADANLGLESDPNGDYVSRRIDVEVNVRATPP